VVDAVPFDPPELAWLEVEVEVLADPVDEALVDVEAVDEEAGVEEPVTAIVLVEAVDLPFDGVELSADAVVLVEVLADPVPPEDAVVELEVEAVAEFVPVFAEVDGLVAAVDWVVEVEDDAGVEGVVAAGVDDPDVVVV
jgi:hypothetical protein